MTQEMTPAEHASEAVERDLPWLRGLARRLAGDQGDDLVHETWILTRRTSLPVDESRSRRPWLTQVMRNRLRMQRRSEAARSRREASAPHPAELPGPDAALDERTVVRTLEAMIEALSPETRELIRQRFYLDRNATQIGKALGIPAATVRTRLRRALAGLRSSLDEQHRGRRAWASVFLGAPTSQWTAWGVMSIKKLALTFGSLAALATLTWWVRGHDDPVRPAVVEAQTSRDPSVVPQSASSGLAASDVRRASWESKRARIRAARQTGAPGKARDPAGHDELADDRDSSAHAASLPSVGLQVALAEVVSGCTELLDDRPTGTVELGARYVGAPGVGTVIESIEVLSDSIGMSDFTTCLTESAYMARLGDPDAELEGEFVTRYAFDDGRDTLREFFEAHRELIQKHEAIREHLALPDGVLSDDLATRITQALVQDEELQRALEAWSASQGFNVAKINESDR
jgi:RNA polymerase sigma factor (sigma-70 family)